MSRSILTSAAVAAGVLVSTAALAGGLGSFTMSNPGVVFQGFPVTFTLSGAPATGGAGLFASIAAPGGSVVCPTQLNGECLDVVAPAGLISVISLAGPGPDTFTVTPPHGASITSASLQAAAVSAGQGYKSNLVDVEVVPTCTPYASSYPAAGDLGVAVTDNLSFTFDAGIADLQQYALYLGPTPVASTVITTATTATVSADADLLPNTTYTLYTRNPCNEISAVPFTTGNIDAVGGANLVGNAYILDLSGLVITTPSTIGGLIAPFLTDYDDTIAIEVSSWDGGAQTFSLMQGWVFQGTTTQDLAESTANVDDIPFDMDPSFGADIEELGGLIELAELDGSVSAGGAVIGNMQLSAYIPTSAIDALAPGTSGLACLLAGGCDPCPINASENCLFVEGNGVVANEVDLTLVAVP